MSFIWTGRAKAYLREIATYVLLDNPEAAKQIRKRIEATAAYLKAQPFMDRPGSIVGAREALPHPRYRMVYQVTEGTVSMLSVQRTSRRWPPFDESDT